jgi:hypothetical protein
VYRRSGAGKLDDVNRLRAERSITVTLPEALATELASMSCGAETTQEDLVVTAVRRLVQIRRAPTVPRYARRLGPMAVPEG